MYTRLSKMENIFQLLQFLMIKLYNNTEGILHNN